MGHILPFIFVTLEFLQLQLQIRRKTQGVTMGGRQSRSKLPVEDMEFLVHNTRYDESTINEWYKGFKQDCPDGRLCKDLFKKIYSKCFPAGWNYFKSLELTGFLFQAMPRNSALTCSEHLTAI